MLHTLNFLSLWAMLTVLLTACGPIYKTSYGYQQPSCASGKRCLRQCLYQRTQCNTRCTKQYNRCKATEEALKLAALNSSHPKKKRHAYSPVSMNCTQACGCMNTYNTCYTSCGGTVSPYHQCSAFYQHSHGTKSHHD